MDSHDVVVGLGELEELVDNLQRGSSSIRKIHLDVLDAVLGEWQRVVSLLVEAHNSLDVKFAKDGQIVSRRALAILG